MIKLFEMFAGYGGASFALKKAGIEHEVVGYSEIDKYAIQCYNQNHKGKNFGDCTKINPNELPDFDLLTGGFPCQSFSVAGRGLGEQDTRGTLFHEIIRIAEIKKPSFMLLENVKGLTFKPHKATFEKILSELDRIGYVVKWKVLNSKDYGIPQNRERVFFVCFRKGMDTGKFSFPQKEELKIFIKDILEEEVDDKYYLTNEQEIAKGFTDKHRVENIVYKPRGDEGIRIGRVGICPCQFREQRGWTQGLHNVNIIYDGKRWRVLTEKETFRFMGFVEDSIKLINHKQDYKLAGNGWDINLVSRLFKAMFNSIVPPTDFPSEFSTSGKRHNIDYVASPKFHFSPYKRG